MSTSRRGRAGLLVAAVLVVTGGWFIALQFQGGDRHALLPGDELWDAWMRRVRLGPLTVVADALAWIGTGAPAIVITGAAVTIAVLRTRTWRGGFVIGLASVLNVSDVAWMKAVAGRVRPDSVRFTAATSFPSGHTANAAVLAVAVALVARRRPVWLGAAFYVCLMAASRTYLHAHWVSDVVAGAAVGSAMAVLAWLAVRPRRSGTVSSVPLPTRAPPAEEGSRRPDAGQLRPAADLTECISAAVAWPELVTG